MIRPVCVTSALAGLGLIAPAGYAQWVTFENDTGTRLLVDSSLGANDTQEKDYAWGDVDNDGDVDLVIARKEPFTTSGRRQNVLLINEGLADGRDFNGVLVDRSSDFASLADDGGDGILDLTNDRDIALADVDLDGWLDIITSTAYGQGLAKSISHARIYMNLGEIGGVWQGFQYEEARIPQLIEAPNTCAVGVGDVNMDGYPDLYFVSYNSTTLQDHLLVNQGPLNPGFFTEESNRLTANMLSSSFGTGSAIADMNGDTFPDIVKSENGPVEIFYNNGSGNFNILDPVSSGAHYFFSLGELNNDGELDLIISDDGADRYRLNLGAGGNGISNFTNQTFSFTGGGFDDGFGGNSTTADLNNDGFNDVVLTDVDVDAGGCGRRTHIYRNLGNLPSPTLQEEQIGGLVANIPTSMLTGTHDAAVFDLNGDGWLDMVLGRCSGTQVWMNVPPIGLIFTYPSGLPTEIEPDEPFTMTVALQAVGDAEIDESSGLMHYSVNGAPFSSTPLTSLGGGQFQADLPAAECTSIVSFYFSASLVDGPAFSDPPGAPGNTYSVVASFGSETILRDEIEEDVSGWTLVAEGGNTTGVWTQVEPIGTVFNGNFASPPEDATSGHEKVMAFVTGPTTNPAEPSESDVDNGPVRLITPPLNLAGTIATISYSRWFFSAGGGSHIPDFLTVDISNDGGNSWVPIPEHTTGGTGSAWETVSFDVSSYIEPTTTVQVRFTTSDLPNNSVTEAGIDDFQVDILDCGLIPDLCPSDLNDDGTTDVQDLTALILNWGCLDPPGPCVGDIDASGEVDVSDLTALILAWGDCP